jgi:3-methyladenine DNA glycosylase AlkD
VFEAYQKARQLFVQTVADQAARGGATEALVGNHAVELLRPLLLDTVPSIQQTAALALGRLADTSPEVAARVLDADVLPQLVYMLADRDRFSKKAAAFVLRALAKHGADAARTVVDAGALDALVACLEEFDPQVKEAAAWALGLVARHGAELAQGVADAGAVPLLILALQEPEVALKRVAASALGDLCKHTPELAQTAVDAGAVAYLAPLIEHKDAKLRRQVLAALAQVAKHSVDLAERVAEAEVFPAALPNLRDADEYVAKNTATLLREVAKHSVGLAQLVVNTGGTAALVDYVQAAHGANKIPGIMALGFIAAASERLAKAVLVSHAVAPVAAALAGEPAEGVRAAAAWTLGQLGRHSPDHARAVADPDAHVLPTLVALVRSPPTGAGAGGATLSNSSGSLGLGATLSGATLGGAGAAPTDLQTKAARALVSIVQKCTHLPALEALLAADVPADILAHVVAQFAKILPHDAQARKAFVASKGLQKVQLLAADPASDVGAAVRAINACYPDEVVRFYTPGYSDALLDQVDAYAPQQATSS